MAPEVIKQHYSGFKSDYWSLGVTLFLLKTMKNPFMGKTHQEFEENILNSVVDFSNLEMSVEFQELLRMLLVKDPELRATGKEIRATSWY